jgi:hypothetical protein
MKVKVVTQKGALEEKRIFFLSVEHFCAFKLNLSFLALRASGALRVFLLFKTFLKVN